MIGTATTRRLVPAAQGTHRYSVVSIVSVPLSELVGGRLPDFAVAALWVHHDPPGFPAVLFLVPSLVVPRVVQDPGDGERQHRPGQDEDPERPGDREEVDVQVVGDLVVGGRGPEQAVEREAG